MKGPEEMKIGTQKEKQENRTRGCFCPLARANCDEKRIKGSRKSERSGFKGKNIKIGNRQQENKINYYGSRRDRRKAKEPEEPEGKRKDTRKAEERDEMKENEENRRTRENMKGGERK